MPSCSLVLHVGTRYAYDGGMSKTYSVTDNFGKPQVVASYETLSEALPVAAIVARKTGHKITIVSGGKVRWNFSGRDGSETN